MTTSRTHCMLRIPYLLSLLFMLLVLYGIHQKLLRENRKFVTSVNSEYCYTYRNEHKGIRHEIYFKTLEECNKPLKK